MARGRAQSKKSNKSILALGIILLLIGIGVMLTAVDLSNLPLLSMVKVETPVGSVTIDEIDEEDAKRIGVGAIVTLVGLVLITKGK